jgi:hypothetical protein
MIIIAVHRCFLALCSKLPGHLRISSSRGTVVSVTAAGLEWSDRFNVVDWRREAHEHEPQAAGLKGSRLLGPMPRQEGQEKKKECGELLIN